VIHRTWIGQEGLERAKKELKKYFNAHQKLPTVSMFSSILRVIRKGYWKEYNIRSWNDLLRDTFEKVNVIHRTWMRNVGLNQAKKTFIEYKIKHKKYPKVNSNRNRDIKRVLNGNFWPEFGIFTWKDLIHYALS